MFCVRCCRLAVVLGLLLLGWPPVGRGQGRPAAPVEVVVVGFDHLSQLYDGQAASDAYGPKKQAELARLRGRLARFRPEAILLEATPGEQPRLDSLYGQYRQGQLQLSTLPNGRSEQYQVGFALARELGLPAPRGIDYYAATSQSLLSTGRNIDLFRRDLQQLQATVRPLRRQVQHDSLSLYDYIALANQPALIALSHRAIFNTPAVVTGGTFSPTGTNTQDLGRVDTAYIGAHYITLFYNRNLKMYANLLRTQQQTRARRLLVIVGVTHVGVLAELLAANPDFRVVPAAAYLKTRAGRRLVAAAGRRR